MFLGKRKMGGGGGGEIKAKNENIKPQNNNILLPKNDNIKNIDLQMIV
jgi:hypothetical protein